MLMLRPQRLVVAQSQLILHGTGAASSTWTAMIRKAMLFSFANATSSQHRLVYEVFAKEGIVRVLRMWSHYE